MSMDNISEEFNAFMTAYSNSAEAVGPTKWKRLEEFMKTSFSSTLEDISKREKGKIAELEETGRRVNPFPIVTHAHKHTHAYTHTHTHTHTHTRARAHTHAGLGCKGRGRHTNRVVP
jgi:ABC-type nickel/cobalt efflux system permease component RcnA